MEQSKHKLYKKEIKKNDTDERSSEREISLVRSINEKEYKKTNKKKNKEVKKNSASTKFPSIKIRKWKPT